MAATNRRNSWRGFAEFALLLACLESRNYFSLLDCYCCNSSKVAANVERSRYLFRCYLENIVYRFTCIHI